MNKVVMLGLADAPARTGHLIEESLSVAGKTWAWFESWVQQPGNLQKLLAIATDLVTENWSQAVQDLAALFSA